MRDDFERRLIEELGGVSVNGVGAPRLWNTSNLAFEGTQSQFLVVVLSEHGLAVSGGSACASGSIEPSGVLLAMGLDSERAGSSLRFSLARTTTRDEIDESVRIILDAVRAARSA